jgi:glycine hydroxymethyltransferase
VSNSHVHHVAALGVALEELESFGAAYARQVVVNARALGETLLAAGIDVLFPEQQFTDCHQLLCDLHGVNGSDVLSALQRAGMHVNAVTLPFRGGPGLRLGVAELTRRGFESRAVAQVGECLADIVMGRASEDGVAARVESLSRAHAGFAFGFDAP